MPRSERAFDFPPQSGARKARIAPRASLLRLAVLAVLSCSLAGVLATPGWSESSATPSGNEGSAGSPAVLTEITGKLVGCKGKPMAASRVEALRAWVGAPVASAQPDKKGKFKLTLSGTGLFLLRMSGADHYPATRPVLIDGPGKMKIETRLKGYDYPQEFSRVSVMGDFNSFSPGSALPMDRQEDGTFTASVPARGDSAHYQLLGVEAKGRSVNGTWSDAYVLDANGDYRSVVASPDSMVRITFDPSKLTRSDQPVQIRFDGDHKRLESLGDLYEQADQGRTRLAISIAYENAIDRARGMNATDLVERIEHARDSLGLGDAGRIPVENLKLARETKDPQARQMLFLYALKLATLRGELPDTLLLAEVAREVPALSSWWSLEPELMALELFTESKGFWGQDYLQTVLDQHPDHAVRAAALLTLLTRADWSGDPGSRALYDRLQWDFKGTTAARVAASLLSPDTKIRRGRKAPDFTVSSLDQPGSRYTLDDFRGKVLLIDFWATWCGPCLGEMAGLQKAYDEFHPKGLEIVSLSFDRGPEAVTNFRQGQWKMPWKNGFVDGGFKSPVATAFEVTAIPKPVLLDRDGRILAVGGRLRGPMLEQTLAKILP